MLLFQRCDIEQDDEEVTGTATNHTQVPNRMKMANVGVEDQEYDAQRVANATDEHPPQSGIGNHADQVEPGEDRHPAQQEIEPGRDGIDAVCQQRFREKTE